MSSLYEIQGYHIKVYIYPECGKLSQALSTLNNNHIFIKI